MQVWNQEKWKYSTNGSADEPTKLKLKVPKHFHCQIHSLITNICEQTVQVSLLVFRILRHHHKFNLNITSY